jgi:hypothetical protein
MKHIRIKRIINSTILIDEKNNVWKTSNAFGVADKINIQFYFILNKKLYVEYLDNLSRYNPIKKLSRKEIIPYLHEII